MSREREDIAAELRHCRVCSRDLPASAFSKESKGRDGLSTQCRECAVARAKAWRAANRERFNATTKASKQRHKDRVNARGAVAQALKRGTLVRQPCEVCATTEDVHAHHDDYTRRLDVRWLCRAHHNEVHREAA